MSQNLLKRLSTSIILLSLLLFINYSHQYIFAISILIVGLIICLEAKKIFLKLLETKFFKKKISTKKFNFNFLILNLITFFYIFFIFCNFSYEIYKFKSPTFFLYIISICIFTDIGGYVFGKLIGGRTFSKISPNKTIAGLCGSLFFSQFSCLIFVMNENFVFNNQIILKQILFSIIAIFGDLFFSFLKRKNSIKDYSNLFPGHGGLFDRIDGMIFVIISAKLLTYV